MVDRLRKSRQDSLASDVSFENEQRGLGKDGEYRWFLIRYNPSLDEDGTVDSLVCDREPTSMIASGSEDGRKNENIALRDEVDKASMFEEIVGESPSTPIRSGAVLRQGRAHRFYESYHR